jgi:hypothetical protein
LPEAGTEDVAVAQNQLARMLKEFGVHTVQAKAASNGQTKNLKHYRLEGLRPLFQRYLDGSRDQTPSKEDMKADGVADTEKLPLPTPALKPAPGKGLRGGSEVAVVSEGRKKIFKRQGSTQGEGW